MKLIEKKCPNCGGSLEFSETDKSCKCEYCHRAFEIERDEKINVGDIAEQFNLSELQGPLKTFGIMHAVVTIFIFLVVIAMFAGIFYSFYKTENSSSVFDRDFIIDDDDSDVKQVYISNVSELTNDDYEELDRDASSKINRVGEGVNNAYESYSMDGDLKREAVYIARKGDDSGNIIVSIYRAYYKDFFHQENRFTVYIPIVYENIKLNEFSKFKNPQINAPEYYFNANNTSYTYGYESLERAYEEVVKPLESDYIVSSK